MKNPRLVLALSASALLSACSSDFGFETVEVQVRCTSPDGPVGVLFVEKGIHGGTSEGSATLALRSILEGRRRFPPDGGFLSIDFDELERESASERGSKTSDDDRNLLEVARGLRVEKTGLFQDDKGRLCLYQLWTLEDPGHALRFLNENWNRDLIREAESGRPSEARFPLLDEASRARALARARSGEGWIRFEDGGFVLELPITRECAAKCAAELLEKEQSRANYGPFLAQATSLEVGEERTLLRYLPGPSGWLGPWSTELEKQGDRRLQTWIQAGALPIGPPPDLRELEKILRNRQELRGFRK
jgi:hypothetical protein